MALTLMYITNNPVTAEIAQDAGVDRIWIDMEYIGKNLRQSDMDTVQNHHTIMDIEKLRPLITSSELMVRVNPIHEKTSNYDSSEEEIEAVIQAGADIIMLPYFRTKEEVEGFISCVKGRAKTMLLVETADAVKNIEDILSVPGIDEVHIGLNDLHIEYHQKFMFELLCDNTIQNLCLIFKKKNIKYGFGGIARVGYGMLPAEYIIAEHYHVGSTAAILSRGFCDANRVKDPKTIKGIFLDGVMNIRAKEEEVSRYTEEQFEDNLNIIRRKVKDILVLMK